MPERRAEPAAAMSTSSGRQESTACSSSSYGSRVGVGHVGPEGRLAAADKDGFDGQRPQVDAGRLVPEAERIESVGDDGGVQGLAHHREGNGGRRHQPPITSASRAAAMSAAVPSYFLVSSWMSSLTLLALVLGELAVFLALLGGLVAVAADVADADLGFLGQFLDAGDELLAGLGRQRRHVDADHAAVVLRVEAQAAGDDRLLDVFDRARVVRADDESAAAPGAPTLASCFIGVCEP